MGEYMNTEGRANIHLHIERLVLDGVPVNGAQALQGAVEAELGRLLAASGLAASLAAGAAVPSLRVGDIRLAAGQGVDVLGGQIAGAVFGGIGGLGNGEDKR